MPLFPLPYLPRYSWINVPVALLNRIWVPQLLVIIICPDPRVIYYGLPRYITHV